MHTFHELLSTDVEWCATKLILKTNMRNKFAALQNDTKGLFHGGCLSRWNCVSSFHSWKPCFSSHFFSCNRDDCNRSASVRSFATIAKWHWAAGVVATFFVHLCRSKVVDSARRIERMGILPPLQPSSEWALKRTSTKDSQQPVPWRRLDKHTAKKDQESGCTQRYS